MPKKKSDISTTKSEIEVVQEIHARLTEQGFSRTESTKGFVWKKGTIWSIFASVAVTNCVAHLEVWNHAPVPGLGSYLIYFLNSGKLDGVLAGMQNAAAPGTATGSSDNAVNTSTIQQAVPAPQKKTLTGFAKGWAIFWIVMNIAGVLAAMGNLSRPGLANLAMLTMLLSAATAAGYWKLYNKNPKGLYIILAANVFGMLLNFVNVPGYSIKVVTGLIPGIITYFITRKQIAYPFGKPLETGSESEKRPEVGQS